MNADLEKSVEELGAGFGGVVARLKGAREIEIERRTRLRPLSYLTAAAVLLAIAFSAVFLSSPPASSGRPSPHEYAMTAAEMIDSQNPDGSWQTVFLTRRNAAALRLRTDEASRIAYKKAIRNLRLRGLLPTGG